MHTVVLGHCLLVVRKGEAKSAQKSLKDCLHIMQLGIAELKVQQSSVPVMLDKKIPRNRGACHGVWKAAPRSFSREAL